MNVLTTCCQNVVACTMAGIKGGEYHLEACMRQIPLYFLPWGALLLLLLLLLELAGSKELVLVGVNGR